MKKPAPIENLPENAKHPWWETLILVVSFVLLWLWMLGRYSARLPVSAPVGPLWTAIQVAALAALVWVFLRRLNRVKRALKQTMEKDFGFVERRK